PSAYSLSLHDALPICQRLQQFPSRIQDKAVIEHHASRHHYVPVHRVQKPELFQNQEQEDYHRAAGVEEVLSPLPQAPVASRNQVDRKSTRLNSSHVAI